MFGFEVAAPDGDSSPEAANAQQAARDAIKTALGELSPALREAVVLRYGQGLTFREVAEIMDCPLKTAESRVRLSTSCGKSISPQPSPSTEAWHHRRIIVCPTVLLWNRPAATMDGGPYTRALAATLP